MSKCSGYGTVKGCGSCIIDLQSRKDIGPLNASAMIYICQTLLKICSIDPKKCSVDIGIVNVYCNGVIRITDSDVQTTSSTTPTQLLRDWLVTQSFGTDTSRRIGDMIYSFVIGTSGNSAIVVKSYYYI